MKVLTHEEIMAKVWRDYEEKKRKQMREQMEEQQWYKEDVVENYMARKFSKYGKYNRYFV